MSADLLRRAATLMRERAEKATPSADPQPGGWAGYVREDDGRCEMYAGPAEDGYRTGSVFSFADFDECDACGRPSQDDIDHIAGWHPSVALAVADWLDGVADRHRPRQNSSGLPDACPDCVGGLGLADPEQVRSCGCWGLSEPICGTCSQSGSAVRRYPQFWPCRDMHEALAVARAYLGETS